MLATPRYSPQSTDNLLDTLHEIGAEGPVQVLADRIADHAPLDPLAGVARPVTDDALIAELAARFRAAPGVDWRLFELTVEVAMVGRAGPIHQVWRDGAGSRVETRFLHPPAAPGRVQ